MKIVTTDIIRVKSSKPPEVEIDTESQSAYVRFSHKQVAKTICRDGQNGIIITLDLDKQEHVVGIELLGVCEFSISSILTKAHVQVPKALIAKARYFAARKHNEAAVA